MKVDNTRVVTVLVNLLQNAARHSEPGTAIRISAKTIGQMVQFSVDDEGPGVPTEGRQDVFEPFYRGTERSVSGKGKTAGTGLGLAVTRAAVEAHAGQIWVDSSEYGGARFSFTMPISSR
ncbi:MAG: sensor histidine kinase [Chloroflexi bacterium]|nr:sensor histidine kinase [Chloroflexota bacterium]